MKKILILMVMVLFLVSFVSAETYYVDATNGNDVNLGTEAEPFQTIQKAADIVVAGDTVIVKDGIYKDHNGDNYVAEFRNGGTNDNWITFRAENKYGAVIDGDNFLTNYGFQIWKGQSWNNAEYIRFEGFVFKDLKEVGIASGSTESPNNIYIYQCKFDSIGKPIVNCDILGSGCYGKAGIYTGPLTSNWTVDSCVFNNIGRTEGGTYNPPEVTYHDYVHDQGWYSQGHHHLLMNSIFYNMTSGWAIKIDGYNGDLLPDDGWTHKLINNVFANDANPSLISGWGLIIFYKNPGLDYKYKNVVIENNIFYDALGDIAIKTAPCDIPYASQWPVEGELHINNNVANDLYLIQECFVPNITQFNNNVYAFSVPEILDTDLGMTDPDNNDFTLTSFAEYLIDRGSLENAPIYDFDGITRPQGIAPDIGAYEFLQSTLTCQSENYSCCDSCESNPQPLYDGDCPGVCCGVCATPSACGDADSDFSGVVSITELINYITAWKAGNVNINDLINGITEWKNGCS